MSRFRTMLIAAAALVAAACFGGGDGDPQPEPSATPDAPANLFVNGGFEDGAEPWFALETAGWGTFNVTADVAHSGTQSARLIQFPHPDYPSYVTGMIQEITPAGIPETVSGAYLVRNWQRGTKFQYLQAVVIVFGSDLAGDDLTNHQLRFVLAGITEPPFPARDAKFVFAGPAEPALDEWVPFAINLREAFEREWGEVPATFVKLRFFFEARHDGRQEGEEQIAADVYFDDLYAGPRAAP